MLIVLAASGGNYISKCFRNHQLRLTVTYWYPLAVKKSLSNAQIGLPLGHNSNFSKTTLMLLILESPPPPPPPITRGTFHSRCLTILVPGLPDLFKCHVVWTIFPLTKWIGGSGDEDVAWLACNACRFSCAYASCSLHPSASVSFSSVCNDKRT